MRRLLLILALALASCSGPDLQPAAPRSPFAQIDPTTTPVSRTPTPVETPTVMPGPKEPSATPSPLPTLTSSSTTEPSVTPSVRPTQASRSPTPAPPPSESTLPPTPDGTLPPPVSALALPPGVEVSVLLGTDSEAPYRGRTDAILLLFLNHASGRASLVSVPRDLYVVLPGRGMDRINTAYVHGGIDLLFSALEYNLGVRPGHWILAHLDDFSRLVDDLGGIDVQVGERIPDPWCRLSPGPQRLNGYYALCYVRSRMRSNDLERNRRQQEVLRQVFGRLMAPENLLRLPELYPRYSETVQTDLALTDLVNYLPFALRLYDSGGLQGTRIGVDEISSWRVPETGAAVLLPRSEKIQALLQEVVAGLDAPLPTSAALPNRLVELTTTPTLFPAAAPPPPETASLIP